MDIVEEARKYAYSEVEKYTPENKILFEVSENAALELAEKLKADKKIVQIGSYFMDLKLPESIKEGKRSEHVEMSSKAAKEFLDKHDIDEESKKKIINCVEAHHAKIPFTCIEAEICANADCYKFIHPSGVLAYLCILGKREKNFKECLKQVESKLEEKHKILSLDICKKELEDYYKTFKKYIHDSKNL